MKRIDKLLFPFRVIYLFFFILGVFLYGIIMGWDFDAWDALVERKKDEYRQFKKDNLLA